MRSASHFPASGRVLWQYRPRLAEEVRRNGDAAFAGPVAATTGVPDHRPAACGGSTDSRWAHDVRAIPGSRSSDNYRLNHLGQIREAEVVKRYEDLRVQTVEMVSEGFSKSMNSFSTSGTG